MATLVLYPHDLDLGELPILLGNVGVSVHAVDFKRLRERGGLKTLGAPPATAIVVLPPQHSALAWIADDPEVVAIMHPPVSGAALLASLRTAARVESARALTRTAREGEELLEIGRALSSERDLPTLQRLIVRKARELTFSDAGSLFVVEEHDQQKRLRFAVAQTGPDDDGVLMDALLPLSTTSIAGYVAVTGESLRIDDAYTIPESAPFRFNRAFDDKNNYRTKSIACVPMRNLQGNVIGAIQLINHKPSFHLELDSPEHTEEVVRPYDQHDERLLTALASQAAVSMENARLVDAIQNLFERFVHASVKAIEVRDKSTQGHSERVAALTVAQAEAINEIDVGPLAGLHFTVEQIREARYASLLHDFGKVAVPEYIFAKAKKLPDGRLDTIRLRFLLAIEQAKTAEDKDALRELMTKIENANEPNVVADAADETMLRAMDLRYRDVDGPRQMIEPFEYDYLTIPRGSLSNEERDRMQEHVTQSFLFLREIPWQETPWRDVPDIAYGHHEHLDGTGYPRKLKGEAIKPQVRMMTISDVFDALTASDRPYKKGMSIERALDILTKEFAQRGKVDPLLLDVFITKRLYDVTHGEDLNPLIKHVS
ncbi:MAG TPA: HD domain-containing phosphohydrolase [Candidatus Baltobacteraceae bacterium]|nr:HD domain-containing phosphohydrolase [Candidatus Baltobacteraceae bacterium]